MNLNKKLSNKTVAISFTIITLFVAYVSYVAYGMQKSINSYRAITPSFSSR